MVVCDSVIFAVANVKVHSCVWVDDDLGTVLSGVYCYLAVVAVPVAERFNVEGFCEFDEVKGTHYTFDFAGLVLSIGNFEV